MSVSGSSSAEKATQMPMLIGNNLNALNLSLLRKESLLDGFLVVVVGRDA